MKCLDLFCYYIKSAEINPVASEKIKVSIREPQTSKVFYLSNEQKGEIWGRVYCTIKFFYFRILNAGRLIFLM